MKVVVVGLGIQGRKRLAVAGADAVATVDPVVEGAAFRRIEEVPLDAYEAALVCTPDQAKIALLEYLLGHGKHVLVEKPLVSVDAGDLARLSALAARNGVTCYTAYNHRFEPHIAGMKRVIDQGRIGRVYRAAFFYGNGTARIFRDSGWRDQGLGVIPDLASHLLDMCEFLFGRPAGHPEPWACHRFENASPDHFVLGYPDAAPALVLEGTLLSWRNTFRLDVFGEEGSAHIDCLCKWGPSTLTVRTRVLPSGKPPEERHVLEQADPTWAIEYEHFTGLCRTGESNIDTDVWINDVLNGLGRRLGVAVHG
ncbi:MAG: Gfo/Idh/MocA family oxidoreductase [Acidimicrobiia bacterium]|nr:Gfo/Idh/MocA family oxidoreductase [Acidimicrobiia bacterium]